jgi:hypothetical protein
MPVLTEIQTGTALKTIAGQIPVTFTRAFASPPTVVLTPVFSGTVSAVDTVLNVTESGFYITSPNAAPDYYVNWIAVVPGS